MKILVTILTHSGSQSNADTCIKTWVNDIHHPHEYYFYGDDRQSNITARTWNCTPDDGESRRRLAQKSYKMLIKSLNHQWDFLFKCDDDTFVAFDRLINLLKNYNSKDDLYIGTPLNKNGIKYGQGGAGYILTRTAVKKYIEVFELFYNDISNNKFAPPFGQSEDYSMGFSLKEKQINLTNTNLLSTPDPAIAKQNQSVCIDAIIKDNKITTHYVKPNTMKKIYNKLQNIIMNQINNKIHSRGFWQSDNINHFFDKSFSKTLNSIVSNHNSFVDFGCGDAKYAKYIRDNNPSIQVEAYDGNPNVELLTGGFGKVLDLSKRFDLRKKYDVVSSLEVAEHIPKEYEKIYIENLLRHCNKLLIISWAKIGQGGQGHVNEQNQDYILDIMGKYGLKYDNKLSKILKDSSTSCHWFRNTAMIFNL